MVIKPIQVNERFVLVTGASSDLGIPIVEHLLQKGFTVLAHYGSDDSRLRPFSSSRLHLLKADLTDLKQVESLAVYARETFKGLDVLINLIGPMVETPLLRMKPEQWRQAVDLNLNVAFYVTFAVQELLRDRKGHVINFSYAGAEEHRPWPQATAYGAAKAGLSILTKSLAVEFAAAKVRVNAIAPGYLDLGKFSEAKLEELRAEIPLNRLGKAEEVVQVLSWLIEQSPEYVTGASIPIAGAWEHSSFRS